PVTDRPPPAPADRRGRGAQHLGDLTRCKAAPVPEYEGLVLWLRQRQQDRAYLTKLLRRILAIPVRPVRRIPGRGDLSPSPPPVERLSLDDRGKPRPRPHELLSSHERTMRLEKCHLGDVLSLLA